MSNERHEEEWLKEINMLYVHLRNYKGEIEQHLSFARDQYLEDALDLINVGCDNEALRDKLVELIKKTQEANKGIEVIGYAIINKARFMEKQQRLERILGPNLTMK